MSARRLSILLAVFALSLSSAARAQHGDPSPAQMLFDLQNLQTSIAQGDKAAYAGQPSMLHDMGVAFSAASPDVWKNTDNIHAAIAFVLSGGPPRSIEPLMQSGGLPKEEDRLLRGALAYVVGREDEARSLLGGVDAKTLDLRLAGQVAFVQSMLLASKDKKKAVEMLDLARLLAPGGLVEEAALRREISLTAEMRDVDRFTALSRQYLNRFSKSIYAANFIATIAFTVARLGLAEDLVNFHKFDSLTAALPAAAQSGFYLAIARAALVDAKVEVADVAARIALLQAPEQSADETRGKFYGAAARMLTADYDQSVAELNAIDRKKLPKRDIALLAAARDVAKHLREPPQEIAAMQSVPPAADSHKDADGAMATIRLAEAAVARSDALVLERSR
jgi:chemotaxis protein MotC